MVLTDKDIRIRITAGAQLPTDYRRAIQARMQNDVANSPTLFFTDSFRKFQGTPGGSLYFSNNFQIVHYFSLILPKK